MELVLMGFDFTSYRKMFQNLLPKGAFWNRREGSTLTQYFDALGNEFSRIDGRVDDLIEEKDTRYTTELLEEWERDLGLPDECSADGASVAERRQLVHAKVTSKGDLSPQYFMDLAESYGYTATITTGTIAGGNIFEWWLTVTYLGTPLYFVCGEESCGDYLSYIPSLTPLFCLANKLKPAWTLLHEAISGPCFTIAFGIDFAAVRPWNGWTDYLQGAFAQAFSLAYDVRLGGCFDKHAFLQSNFNLPA